MQTLSSEVQLLNTDPGSGIQKWQIASIPGLITTTVQSACK
jgi:hypothetical protein